LVLTFILDGAAAEHSLSPLPRLVAVVGPTASGKSSLAFRLARRFQGEILSADSMQVYRRMDIGTAKPSRREREVVPHHLIDILDPDQDYSAALFREQAEPIILRLHEKGTPVFVAGGTGLYLKALTRGLFRGPGAEPDLRRSLKERAGREGNEALHRELAALDPEAASRIHPRDLLRIVRALEVHAQSRRPISCFHRAHAFQERPYEILKIGLALEREALYRRIEERVDQMIAEGWVEEVRGLLAHGYSCDLKSMSSLGYRHLAAHLQGEVSLAEAVAAAKRDTRRYAKRQMTWFRADKEIHWIEAGEQPESRIEELVEDFLKPQTAT
jgi:tRNA dimethylallyltransferase